MLKTRKNQKGFTLTELIIVIVIIGILAAVLIPTLSSYVARAKKSAAEQNAVTMYQEFAGNAKLHFTANTEATNDDKDYDVSEEELADLLVAHYFVYSGKYKVEIKNGAVVGSEEAAAPATTELKEYGSEKSKNSEYSQTVFYDLSQLVDNGYLIITGGKTYLSAAKN